MVKQLKYHCSSCNKIIGEATKEVINTFPINNWCRECAESFFPHIAEERKSKKLLYKIGKGLMKRVK